MNRYIKQRLKEIVKNQFLGQIKSVNLDLLDLKGYKGPFVWKASKQGTLLITLNTPVSFLFYEAIIMQEPSERYYYYDGLHIRKISRDQALKKVWEQCKKLESYSRISA